MKFTVTEKQYNFLLEQSGQIKKSPKNSGETSPSVSVLVGGLDSRPGDLSLDKQVDLLKSAGLRNVKGFRYNTPTQNVLDYLERIPNASVYLFSKGCEKAESISSSPFVNKNKIYIIEPYAKSKGTKRIVQAAVANGVPAQNVFVGAIPETGAGVVKGVSSSNGKSHWDALKQVALRTKNN